MKYLFIILCTVLSIVNWITPLDFGYTESSAFYTHFTYLFVHANVVHLALNMYIFWKLYDTIMSKKLFYFALPISVISSFLFSMPVPTVGASGVLFALLGIIYTTNYITKKIYIQNLVIIIISTIIGYFANVNIAIHILCLLFGLATGFLYSFYSLIKTSRLRDE